MSVLNFEWRIPDQLATGGKPSYQEQLKWLLSKGFGAIVSLEPVPDIIVNEIAQNGLDHLRLDIDDDSDNDAEISPEDWQNFCQFLLKNLGEGKIVFVHCSAGIKRSPLLVRRFLQEHSSSLPG